MNPDQNMLGLQLPDVYGDLQFVSFQHRQLFDREWHKVMLAVTQDQAVLWVDCKKVPGVRGQYAEIFDQPRGQFDASGGHLHISKTIQMTETVPVC